MHRAVAMAAMPSPRPVRPSPSVVVADTVIEAFAAADSFRSASARRGANFGRFPTICTATLPISKPAARTRAAASASNAAPEAPFHCGSPVPNWAPRSPRPAAENRASQAACAATSPSEWPLTPVSSGHSKPARNRILPDTKGWTSVPTPTLGILCINAVDFVVLSGGENLVEERLGLVLVGLLRECELAHEYLARLGEHTLLAG